MSDLYREFFGHKKNIKEAELLNKLADYNGGVVYKLIDPASHENVKTDIEEFVRKNGIYIVTSKFDTKRGYGYFYFRIGEDPAKESQKIQGFISQLPEVAKFKFTTMGASKKPKTTKSKGTASGDVDSVVKDIF
jgi:hypothetical protein